MLGPVIIKEVYFLPISISIGTTSLASIKGWRAFFKLMIFSELISGVVQFNARE